MGGIDRYQLMYALSESNTMTLHHHRFIRSRRLQIHKQMFREANPENEHKYSICGLSVGFPVRY